MSVDTVEKNQNMTNGTGDPKVDHQGDCAALRRPTRDDSPFENNVFPDTTHGRLLSGILKAYLIKQEPRLGWARKGACSETTLLEYPCEVVAAHQWGVAWLIMTLVPSSPFRQEMLPDFDISMAMQMGLIHDVAESITGDITPVDGISADEKHRLESKAMESILAHFPDETAANLHKTYSRYEDRQCVESKFVKDCDRLDFMITAFLLERQGFKGFSEFYGNSNKDFHTQLAQDLANQLIATRNQLANDGNLYPKRTQT